MPARSALFDAAARETFERDGYARLPGLIPPPVLERLRGFFDPLLVADWVPHKAVADAPQGKVVTNIGRLFAWGDPAPLELLALPEIMDAVGDKIEVHLDSGIRSGQDVLKAVAMGAKGTYIGRAFIYGLGAMGEAGVTRALEVIHKELDVSMALCGKRDIKQVNRDILRVPEDFGGRWQR